MNLRTDDAGLFSVGLSEPGRYVLTAFREGYTRSTTTVEFWMKGMETAEIILRPGDAIYGNVYQNLSLWKLLRPCARWGLTGSRVR